MENSTMKTIAESTPQLTVADGTVQASESTGKGLSILVVEDNADMRGYIRSILRDKYNVLEAAHGEEALTILNSHAVDFIISDLMMPVPMIANPYAVVGPPAYAPGCPHPAAAALAGAVQGGGAGAVIGSFGGTAEDVRHGAAIGAGLGAVAGLAAAASACPPPD